MDCEDVLASLFEYIDRELPVDEAADVRRHIEDCCHCADAEKTDRAFIECVKQKLRGRPVPGELAKRVESLLSGLPR